MVQGIACAALFQMSRMPPSSFRLFHNLRYPHKRPSFKTRAGDFDCVADKHQNPFLILVSSPLSTERGGFKRAVQLSLGGFALARRRPGSAQQGASNPRLLLRSVEI
jgi:hypothetical protein